MSGANKYKENILELNQKWGPKAERYIFLGIAFLFSWILYIPLILIHTKMAGLKKEDKDLFTFYFPIMLVVAALHIIPFELLNLKIAYQFYYLGSLAFILTWILIVLDIYFYEFEDKRITFDLIKLPSKFIRTSVPVTESKSETLNNDTKSPNP